MAEKKTTAQRVAENIKSTYGLEKLRYLLNEFSKGTSGQEIANEFGVTRQRVNQWKKKLGTEHLNYVLAPGVEQIINGDSSSSLSTRSPI